MNLLIELIRLALAIYEHKRVANEFKQLAREIMIAKAHMRLEECRPRPMAITHYTDVNGKVIELR